MFDSMESISPDVVRGFSVWLEPESLHYHTGIVQVRALWGRMMQREGFAEPGGWTCYALDPSGVLMEADVAPGEGNFHKVAFFADREGLYNLAVENDAGIFSMLPGENSRYFQRARIPVPVGHHVHGRLNNLVDYGLDVFCDQFRDYRPGDSVTLRVYYNGRPLPGAELKATCHLYNGTGYPWRGNTGEDGGAAFTFSGKGHWMFTCTYNESNHNKEAEYIKTVYTSTFVVAGVR